MNINKLQPGDKVRFKRKREDSVYSEGIAYILWFCPDGQEVQLSENKTVETMGLAQNWVVKKEDIIAKVYDEEIITHEKPEYVIELDIKKLETEYPSNLSTFGRIMNHREAMLYGNYGIRIESSRLKILKDYLPIKADKIYVLTIKEKE